MRTIHRLRNSRLRTRRSRYAYVSPFSTVSRAWRYCFRRPPTLPLANFSVFLWRARALVPRLTRGIAFSSNGFQLVGPTPRPSGLALGFRLSTFRSQIRNQGANRLGVGRVDGGAVAQVAFLLARLRGQDVAQIRLAAPDLSRPRDLEAF